MHTSENAFESVYHFKTLHFHLRVNELSQLTIMTTGHFYPMKAHHG